MQILPYLRSESSLQFFLLASTSVCNVSLKIFTIIKSRISSHLISLRHAFFNVLVRLVYYFFATIFSLNFFLKKIIKANCQKNSVNVCTWYKVWLQVLYVLFLKIVVYVKYKVIMFLVVKFPIGRWSVQLIGGQLVGGRWPFGRLVGVRW